MLSLRVHAKHAKRGAKYAKSIVEQAKGAKCEIVGRGRRFDHLLVNGMPLYKKNVLMSKKNVTLHPFFKISF